MLEAQEGRWEQILAAPGSSCGTQVLSERDALGKCVSVAGTAEHFGHLCGQMNSFKVNQSDSKRLTAPPVPPVFYLFLLCAWWDRSATAHLLALPWDDAKSAYGSSCGRFMAQEEQPASNVPMNVAFTRC